MTWIHAKLKDGPFAGDEGEIPRTPEYIRCWAAADDEYDVTWADEQKVEWPENAARYALLTSKMNPVLYVYAGVGDGGLREILEEADEPRRVGRQHLTEKEHA